MLDLKKIVRTLKGQKVAKKKTNRPLDGILPLSGTRWVSRAKADLLLLIRSGQLTREEAYKKYALSPEELLSWEAAFDAGGRYALACKLHMNFRK